MNQKKKQKTKYHTKEDCPCPYTQESVRIGRAHTICPVCKRDVTFEEYMMYKSLQSHLE